MLTYHKGTTMTWREIKGEEKWVSVPQAEGRVTDFLAFTLSAFPGRKDSSPGSPEEALKQGDVS